MGKSSLLATFAELSALAFLEVRPLFLQLVVPRYRGSSREAAKSADFRRKCGVFSHCTSPRSIPGFPPRNFGVFHSVPTGSRRAGADCSTDCSAPRGTPLLERVRADGAVLRVRRGWSVHPEGSW